MALVVPDKGEVRLLRYIVNKDTPTNLVLHLYTNEVDLSTESFEAAGDGSSGSFTEVSASGYAAVTLSGANWTASTSTGVSSAVHNTGITFSFTTGVDVQGYYVTNTSNQIMWAEEFPGAPFTLPSTGGDIAVKPQIQLN